MRGNVSDTDQPNDDAVDTDDTDDDAYDDANADVSGNAGTNGDGGGYGADATDTGGGVGGAGYMDVDAADSPAAANGLDGLDRLDGPDPLPVAASNSLDVEESRPRTASSSSGRFTTGGSTSSERLLGSPNRARLDRDYFEDPPTVCGFNLYKVLQVLSLLYALIKAGFDFANTVGG
jgi:hypothetical protein